MSDLRGGFNRQIELPSFSADEVEKSVAYGRREIFSTALDRAIKVADIAPDIAMSDLMEIEIDADRIYSREDVLGEGAFGKVYKGNFIHLKLYFFYSHLPRRKCPFSGGTLVQRSEFLGFFFSFLHLTYLS